MDLSPDRLAIWVSRLVQVPSVNPLQAGPRAGVPGERALAHLLAAEFTRLGAREVVLDTVVDDRPNVYGVFPGRTDRLVVLDVHTDTVTVENMVDDPFDGRVEDGHVWGRGALDTKASLGIALALLESWKATGRRPEPTLLVVGSASEEAGGLMGATVFRRWAERRGLTIDQMLVAEPTDLAPVHGHKGGVIARVTAHGLAVHSATPHLGRNAIEAMAPVIAAIQTEHDRLGRLAPSTELGNGTLTVTLIDGGTGNNVVPDRCSLVVSRRIAPGEDPDEEFERITRIARAACPLPVDVTYDPPPRPGDEPGSRAFYAAADSPLARRIAELSGSVPKVVPFGTNALRYDGFGGDKVVFGPGSIEQAHRERECVAVDDLVATARVLEGWLEPA
jgi:acetylornithine deacetylase/succinyl-diaminopimelate desuccinylase-like protein